MSISLTSPFNEGRLHLHSFDEDFYATNPEKHTTHPNVVTIYILLNGSSSFGVEHPILRDAMIPLKREDDTMYRYLQNQYHESTSRYDNRYGGWIYADELDINTLLKKE